MYINEILNQYVIERGIKQSYISQKTGIHPNTISKILNSKRAITAEEFLIICNTLNIDPNIFRKKAS